MGFLESLFGKRKEPVDAKQKQAQVSEMSGQSYSFNELDVLVLNHVVEDDRHPFPERKKQEYFRQFGNEPLVFDGQVRSLLVTNAYVKRDLTGSLNAYLFSQTGEEVITEHEGCGEYPTPVATLYLEVRDGLYCIKVSKWRSSASWSNKDYESRHGH
jgi:hypothetical protein